MIGRKCQEYWDAGEKRKPSSGILGVVKRKAFQGQSLMMQLSEMILACSYCFIGVGVNSYTLFGVNWGLYTSWGMCVKISRKERSLVEGSCYLDTSLACRKTPGPIL